VKLILSENELQAIQYYPNTLSSERCYLAIVHVGELSLFGGYLCVSALYEQRMFEIYRAYKDFNKHHTIKYLKFPKDEYHHQLAAFLQITYMLGGFTEVIYPKKYYDCCNALKGNIKLTPYFKENPTEEALSLQNKALKRFRTIII